MATKNIVPRADGEGSLGRAAKQWGDAQVKKINGKTPAEFVAAETPKAHALDAHTAVTLAELSAKISDKSIASTDAATTSAAGLVELATDAETRAMTAGTVITASNLAAWARTGTVTVTVGPTGCDYTTLNAAITALCKRYPGHGATATIDVAEDFVMAEQVLVIGQNLGWITISGTNPASARTITASAITSLFAGHYPAFGGYSGATLPYVDLAFSMDSSGSNKVGLYLVRGSTAPSFSRGIKNASGYAAAITGISTAYLAGDWSGASGSYGLSVAQSSFVFSLANFQKGASPDTTDHRVVEGGILTLHSTSVGGISQTKNTLTQNGIIFDPR